MPQSVNHQKLTGILDAIDYTDYGEAWPEEFGRFYRVWGFFNSIYNLLYDNESEWQRIAQLALDPRFNYLTDVFIHSADVQELASLPCVGDGKYEHAPSKVTRISFYTLRIHFNLTINDCCNNAKCQSRLDENIQLCRDFYLPSIPPETSLPEYAKYTPFGATLLIIYQIRNNLFHGAKNEISGPSFDRNKQLVGLSYRIIITLLQNLLQNRCWLELPMSYHLGASEDV